MQRERALVSATASRIILVHTGERALVSATGKQDYTGLSNVEKERQCIAWRGYLVHLVLSLS